MDVLEYWTPDINWTQFKRGPISERAWSAFKGLVQLCHAHGHWAEAARNISMSPPGPSIYGPDNKYQRNKRRGEWKLQITKAEGHMNRAAFLADEKIAEISNFTPDVGTPDYRLYIALRGAIGSSARDYVSANWKMFAFASFDGETELADPPDAIIRRWSSGG